MDNTRRKFLKQTGAGLVGATVLQAPQLWAAPRDKARRRPALIAVYLRGGADPLGSIVPYTDRELPKVRPNLTLPGPDSGDADRLLPLDETFGLNPNMKELHELYQQGLCAPIVCVGSPHPTRSHFDAQDFMERAAPGMKYVTTGWLNRYLQETRSRRDANLRAFSLQPLLPRSLRGRYPVLARPDKEARQAMRMYYRLYPKQKSRSSARGTFGLETQRKIRQFGARTIEQLHELNSILEKMPSNEAPYPESRFGRQMRDIAKVIKADRGFEATALDYNGWDHHIDEGPLDGTLGNKLGDVSAAVGAFVKDLGPRMQHVLILVMSEFGRTVRENGNRGTDHGHGGFMLAVGGPVRGGRVYGKWTGLERDRLYQRRDLPVHTDFRRVFAETLNDLYDFDGIRLGMFPEYTPENPPLDFLQTV